ncbi:hypothetical protein [Mycobacterium sp. ENV421]|uniref:hypothetical protein n=1 Tax=Mycobacterium sp. ENV421 TaxID=1213407 RepID=UPI001E32704B|nr:hypothetical protein [Mycobacterium sp. ENV421]
MTMPLSNPAGLGANAGVLTDAGTDDADDACAVRRLPLFWTGFELVELADGMTFGVASLAAALAAVEEPADSLDFVVAEGFERRLPLALAVPVARGPAWAEDDPPDDEPPAEEADEDAPEELPVESAAATP